MKTETSEEAALPHNHGAKSERIDLGLAVLSAMAPARAALPAEDIAAWCDCTAPMISSIEARALRKLRERVREQFKLAPTDMKDLRRFLALHFGT